MRASWREQIIKERNMSKIESIWARELAEYMEERYGIDLDEVILSKYFKIIDYYL